MMSQFPALERLRPLLRLEYAILVALLLVAAVWFNFSSKVDEVRVEETRVQKTLKAAVDDLNLFSGNNERAELEEELGLLQLQLQQVNDISLELSPKDDALLVRDDILAYVDQQQLALNAFGQLEGTTAAGDEELLTIRYSFTVQGDEEALVGVLSLLNGYPTASVQSLRFTRLAEDLEGWEMSLELAVFFLGPEEDQEQGN